MPLRWRLAEAGTADLLIGMLSRHPHREDKHAHFFSPRSGRCERSLPRCSPGTSHRAQGAAVQANHPRGREAPGWGPQGDPSLLREGAKATRKFFPPFPLTFHAGPVAVSAALGV